MATKYLGDTTITIEHEITWATTGEPIASAVRQNVWWNHYWPYRRRIKIEAPPVGLEKGHPIVVYVPRVIATQGKVRSDLADVEVVYLVSNLPERWKVIPSTVEAMETAYRVRFDLVEPIHDPATPNSDPLVSEGDYFIYYGNKDLRQPPLVAAYAYDDYPIESAWNEGGFTFTNIETDWNDNVSTVLGARANFTFYGDQIKLYATTGKRWGRALVTITNTSSEQSTIKGTSQIDQATPSDYFSYVIDLQTADVDTEELVLTVTGLPDKIHHLRIEDIGTTNPNIADYRINFTKVQYKKHGVGEDLYEEADSTMNWSAGYGGSI